MVDDHNKPNEQIIFGSPSTNDPVLKADSAGFTIPFTIVGKLIILQAKIDKTEGNFVLDTGAPGLVLNKTYFRNLEPVNTDETSTGVNGTGNSTERVAVNHIKFGAFNYYKTEADLLSLSHLENSRGIKILGLLGVNLFKECEMVIDYEKKIIHLHCINRKQKKTYKNLMLTDSTSFTEHSFILKNNRIVLNTFFAKKRMDFVIDCGAETNLLDSRLPDNLLDSVQVNGRVLITGTGTKKVEAVTGSLAGLSIEGLDLPEMPVVITNFENSCFGDDNCIKGVLGHDFLSNYKVIFNFVSCKLYIIK